MAIEYKVRIVCEHDDEWHYYRETQTDTVDENIVCPEHEGSTMRDFVIEEQTTV